MKHSDSNSVSFVSGEMSRLSYFHEQVNSHFFSVSLNLTGTSLCLSSTL